MHNRMSYKIYLLCFNAVYRYLAIGIVEMATFVMGRNETVNMWVVSVVALGFLFAYKMDSSDTIHSD